MVLRVADPAQRPPDLGVSVLGSAGDDDLLAAPVLAGASRIDAFIEADGVVAVVPQSQTIRVSARETVGLITRKTLESSASIVSAVPPRVMLGQGDHVYIGLGADDVQAGDEFTVFRTREKVFDPENGRMLGYHVDLLGWALVLEPYDDTSLAEIKRSALSSIETLKGSTSQGEWKFILKGLSSAH